MLMKKMYKLFTAGLLISASVAQVNAQCAGNRYHDYVFTGVDITNNITYGTNTTFSGSTATLKLDVYQPQGDTLAERPLIIWTHGGSFVGGSKGDAPMVKIASDFAKMGYVTASIDYRLFMTDLPFPGPDSNDAGAAVMRAVHDAKAAVRYFRKNYAEGGNTYKIDTSKIYFGGASAGGIIALHLGYMDKPEEFPSYIDTTGTTQGNVTGQQGLHGGIEGLSGNQGYSSDVKAIINLSGAILDTNMIGANDLPLFSSHATGDGTVPYGTELIYLSPPSTFPIQVIDGSASVMQRADEMGLVNCFKTYYVNDHVPEADQIYYDTTVCLIRNFLEHLQCGTAFTCNFTGVVTGVNQIAAQEITFNVYPNPASDAITIDFSKLSSSAATIELYDAMGRKVKTVSNIKATSYTLNRDTLANGIYSVNIITEDKVFSKKIMFN